MNKILHVVLISFLTIYTNILNAQSSNFDIYLEPISIDNLGGIQSFSWGQHDGKWLIIGGRLDGLHRRQPFAAFDVSGNNNELIVVDPIAGKKWSAPLTTLPIDLREQLSSTNMEFYQADNMLYLIGGYGFSPTKNDHITFPYLTAIDVEKTINAIVNQSSFENHFRQIHDTIFAVTGGYLNKIYDTYYLTGGQNFIGRYNPMGPDHGPGFVQEYTNAIQRFQIQDDGQNININHLPIIKDAANLHRRDYNAVPQIFPNGEEGITAFSGVFQQEIDLPFLNPVDIDSTGHYPNNNFQQYFNHYHCAHIPLYSSKSKEMHNVFFGGISQYYMSQGLLVQDNNVPFVRTIARVTRDEMGNMAEYKFPLEMPGFLGAGSEFIPLNDLPQFNNNVLKIDDFTEDSTFVGYIFGGIKSTQENVFFSNDENPSSASNEIYKIYILKNNTVDNQELNPFSVGSLQLQVYPNPSDGHFLIIFNLKKASDVHVEIRDVQGKIVENKVLKDGTLGNNIYAINIEKLENPGIYFIQVATEYEKVSQKIVIDL